MIRSYEKRGIYTIILISVLFLLSIHAQSIDNADISRGYCLFQNNCAMLIDSSFSGTADSIFSVLKSMGKTAESIPVNLGYISSPVWVLLPPLKSNENMIFRIKHAQLDTVEVFIGDSSEFLHYASCGFLIKKTEPAIQDLSPCFSVPKELSSKYILIKIRTSDVCTVDIEAFNTISFIKLVQSTNRLYGLYFGSVLILALINFFLFVSAKYVSSLWYSLYILSFALFQACTSGLVDLSYVYNNSLFLKNSTPFFACLCLSFGSFFTYEFLALNFKKWSLIIPSIIFRIFEIIGVLLSIIALYDHGTFSSIVISVAAPVFLVACLATGISRIKSLNRPAVFYTIAIIVLGTGNVINSLRNFGFISNSFFAEHGNLIGSVFEFIIIAIALVDRISSIEKEKNEAHIETQYANQLATESHLKALQAQINPHFLFNTLNTLAELVSIFPDKAEKLVIALSKFFRYTLTASEKKIVHLKDEIEIVRSYLMIEQIRFGNRLEYEINIAGCLENIYIVGLLIQPIVENCIKYGVSPLPKGGKVTLNFSVTEENIQVSIHDNGPGFENCQYSNGTSHGLYNVRERLKFTYGGHAKLSCSNMNGALVELIVPLKEIHGI